MGGCSVSTRVSLTDNSSGRGAVTVSVTFDRASVDALGGLSALRSDLSVGDLRAAGWKVIGPEAAPAGAAEVTASHAFAGATEATQLLAQLAGPSAFRLAVTRHRSFWHTDWRLSGKVDLTCGLSCFGDAGLRASTGSPIGVDPGSAPGPSAFTFSLDALLPGRVHGTNAATRSGSTLEWRPVLGRSVTLAADTQSVNGGAVVAAIVAGSFVVAAASGGGWWFLFRRRRRRRAGHHSPAHARRGETVSPPS